jgi:glycolate oxidase FAD binding subunit
MVNAAGPRRFGYGTFRDFVIGLTAIDARGRTFHGGGRVVKNVAGYDVCKLLVGSLGTLAIVSQVTLKLRPVCESSLLVWVSFADWDEVDLVLECLTTSDTRPVAVDVLAGAAAQEIAGEVGLAADPAPALCVGFEGHSDDVQWQCDRFCDEISGFKPTRVEQLTGDVAGRMWTALTEYGMLTDSPLTFQACVLPSRVSEFLEFVDRAGVAVAAHAANGVVRGHFPDRLASLETVSRLLGELRAAARTHHGHVSVLDCDPAWKHEIPVFEIAPEVSRMMRAVKLALDPDDLLNRHRFFHTAAEKAS